jgi:hypothetical protein
VLIELPYFTGGLSTYVTKLGLIFIVTEIRPTFLNFLTDAVDVS